MSMFLLMEGLADLRGSQYSQGHGFNMMSGTPQFVQPGVPMMQQQKMMMSQGHMMGPHGNMMAPGSGQMMYPGQPRGQPPGQGMYPMNMMGMRMPPRGPTGPPSAYRAPTGAPPAYSQAHKDGFQQRQNKGVTSSGNRGNMNAGKTEEQIQKERYFQQQQAKLKQFGKSSGSAGLDPNKLIDSMFTGNEPPKPRTIKKQPAQPAPEITDEDNGFGDFLSSPPSTVSDASSLPQMLDNASTNPTQNLPATNASLAQGVSSTPNTEAVTAPVSTPAKPAVEKKDLTKMMFDSCDLNAPQKARLFQKPSLKDIHVDHHPTQHVQHPSHNARRWERAEELSNLFIQEAVKDEKDMPQKSPDPVLKKGTSPTSKHPPKPPPWVTDEKLLPGVYKQVLEASLVDGHISTERLYPILMLSGLPKDLMGHIWSLCNKITPGQLATTELYQLLGLVALAQHQFQIESTDILSRCPQPPVPLLSHGGSNPQHPPLSVTLPSAQSPPLPIPGAQIPVQPNQAPPLAPQPNQTPPLALQPNPAMVAPNAHFLSGPTMDQGRLPTQPVVVPQGEQLPVTAGTSSPALLPVTQLPPAVMPQGMMGNVVTTAAVEDDEFADFQSAPTPVPPVNKGSFNALMTDVKEASRTPVTDQNKYLYSVPTPNDKAVASALSPEDMKVSTVDSFFGSDDSSEARSTPEIRKQVYVDPDQMSSNSPSDQSSQCSLLIRAISPDDEYFDGYKSADSKPSDSTSQFSTDQSEGEDFKNFENYLDEFQRKKEQLDNESPLHRPISKATLLECQTKSPAKLFTKATPVQKIPMPPHSITKVPTQKAAPSDDFADFSGFQSAPAEPEEKKVADQSSTIQQSASGVDLMLTDEDKYAALRTLDFSVPVVENKAEDLGAAEAAENVVAAGDDNWADFQAASEDMVQGNVKPIQDIPEKKVSDDKSSILQLYGKKDDTNWASFGQQSQETQLESGWSAFSSEGGLEIGTQSGTVGDDLFSDAGNKTNGQSGFHDFSMAASDTSKTTGLAGDIDEDDEFSDFQSSAGSAKLSTGSNDIVQVKKTGLATDEILGLFKVKDEPSTVKSRDDDFASFGKSHTSFSESMNRLHGVTSAPESLQDTGRTTKPKLPHLSEDDDFMKPPPLDDGPDDDHDDFGSYSRGYDFDDVMKPKPQEKNVYGLYGANQQFVVAGHKKDTKDNDDTRNVTIEITKDSDVDNDSDSISSKDNDLFRGKFTLGAEHGEDNQSVSSLDFVTNKRIQTLKDGDTQSVSSNDFGGFEAGYNGGQLPESKSVDSLDLRREDGNGADTGGSAEGSDREAKEDSPTTDMTVDDSLGMCEPALSVGLPIVGDRYSSILHDVPGSDKHAYEWQRCLDNACHMIQDANNVFNSISSSAVCNEVIRSSQGSQYVQGIIEIYRVVCKITLSMQKSGIHSDRLGELLKNTDLAWNNLTAFLVGGSVMPESKSLEFSHGVLSPDEPVSQMKACGVCLLDVEMREKQAGLDNDVSKLTYGGRQYHSACANFWINCVDSTLPALSLPELL